MIIGLFKDLVHWLLSLTEVGAVIAAVLLVGLIVGMAGFWVLGFFVSKLAGPPTELDSYPDEPEEIAEDEAESRLS